MVKRGIVQTTAVCSDTYSSIENRSANAQFWPANCKVHSLVTFAPEKFLPFLEEGSRRVLVNWLCGEVVVVGGREVSIPRQTLDEEESVRCRSLNFSLPLPGLSLPLPPPFLQVTLNEEKSVGELNALIAALTKEVERLKAYSTALEGALRAAGGDPSSVVPVEASAAAASAPGGGGGGGGSEADAAVGGDGGSRLVPTASSPVGGGVMEMAKLQAELDRMESKLRIGQADMAEATAAAEEARAAAEAAMAEGGQHKAEMEKMRRQREAEQQLALRSGCLSLDFRCLSLSFRCLSLSFSLPFLDLCTALLRSVGALKALRAEVASRDENLKR